MNTPKILYCYPESAGEMFRPSNGTEGMIFTESFCEQCIYEKFTHTQNHDDAICDVLSASMFENVPEWVYNEEGWPVCTKWQKWDWNNDGDPPSSPPEPQDPNQLMLISITDEILQTELLGAKQ